MSMIEEVGSLLVQLQIQKAALEHYQQNSSALYVLEARYTLFHIDRLFQNKNNPSLAKTLDKFLEARWKRLKNTDAQYFHDTKNPANSMCIKIAKVLGRLQNEPYMLFLMPALSAVLASDYASSAYDDTNLDFKQLMLSDDGTRMIHIPEVLEFAEQDGLLKHSSLFNGKQCELSILEESRLLARHPSVENYYHAVRDKVNFQLHGETVGAYLMRLISGLRKGGVLQGGEEFLAGEKANIAIANFSFFLEALSEEKKREVLDEGKTDRWRDSEVQHLSIGQSWALLVHPSKEEEDEEQEQRYCVELIANDLEEILKDNPMLYQLMPFEQEGVGTLAAFEATVSECKTTMLSELNRSKAHRYYGEVGDDKFTLDVLSKVSRDKAFYLAYPDIAYVAGCYGSDNPALAMLSESILLHTRDYMNSKNLRLALEKLPRPVAYDVNQLVFPKPNRHAFYSLGQRKREDEISSEPSKKIKYMHFDG